MQDTKKSVYLRVYRILEEMGVFLKKWVREALDPRDVTLSYMAVAVCALLVVLNVGFFVLFPRLVAPLAIVLSNGITVLLTFLSFRPASRLIQNMLEKRQQELLQRAEEEKTLRLQVGELENRNRELESRLDTRAQTDAVPGDVNFTFKLEQMEYAKKGYVVKEEDLSSFLTDDRYKASIPDIGLFGKMLAAAGLKENGIRKILYLKKYYYKVSVGIDFSRIKFAFDGDRILFSGVKFSLLHDITSELEHDMRDIDHCWILNATENRTEILHSADYDAFKEAYAQLQDTQTRESLEEEVGVLCRQYTEVFRRSLRERFSQIDFVDNIEDSDKTWYALGEGAPYRMVREVASNMLMLTNVMGQTKAAEEEFDVQ